MLIDEVLTPECSRFWLAETYIEKFRRGESPDLNKDILSRWLSDKGFTEKKGSAPELEDSIIKKLLDVYSIQYKMITGKDLPLVSNEKLISKIGLKCVKDFLDEN